MSGYTCRDREHRPFWAVVQYKCNYSAFNGYRRNRSAYSLVECLKCGRQWRTNAAYVDGLPGIGRLRRELGLPS